MRTGIAIAAALLLTGCGDTYYPLTKNSFESGYSVVSGHSDGYSTLADCENVLVGLREVNTLDGVPGKSLFCSTEKELK